MKYIVFFFLLISSSSFGQSDPIDKIIGKIDFQEDTILSVFHWVTDNMKYDVSKRDKRSRGKINKIDKSKYKDAADYKFSELKKAIKKKKGVCEDYSLLFHMIVSKLGYESAMITGITKNRKGKINSGLGHAWNAVKVDGIWKLYDPTWGAGYINGKDRFVKKYNDRWYAADGEKMKEMHFPYDPIWQLSSNPISFLEFKKGSQSNTEDEKYPYDELISSYLAKDKDGQTSDALSRVELHDGNHKLITKYKKLLSKNMNASGLSEITEVFKSSSRLLSEYFEEGRNKNFKGKKWTKEYSKEVLTDVHTDMKGAIKAMSEIKGKGRGQKKGSQKNISKAKKMVRILEAQLKYLGK